MHVGSADVGGLIEIVEFDDGRDLAWTSVTGIDQRGRWRMRETPDGRTRVTLRPELRRPGRAGRGGDGATVGASGAWEHRSEASSASGQKWKESTSVSEQGRGLIGSVTHGLGEHEGAGRSRHRAADPARQAGAGGTRRPLRWGRSPAAGFIAGALRTPRRAGGHRRAGHAHLPGGRPALQRAGARFLGPRGQGGRRRGDHVPQPPRLRGGHGGGGQAGRQRALPEHRVRRARSSRRSSSARSRSRSIYDEEFADLLEEAGKRRKRFVAWHDTEEPGDPTLDELIDGSSVEAPVPPSETGRAIILTSGTTGTPKGANRGVADIARPGRVAAVEDPAELPPDQRTWRRRCSTPGGSPTSPWGCCWAPRWCSPASSTPRTAWPLIERTPRRLAGGGAR